MAIFGRNTARQRLRRATRESLTIPAFSSPVDCTPWVAGGLWPAELANVTDETAALAEYLRADLQRIVDAANIELRNIRVAVLAVSARQPAEARVINSARAFATRRVESTVRHLRGAVPEWPTQYLHLTKSDHPEQIAAVSDPARAPEVSTNSVVARPPSDGIDAAQHTAAPDEPEIIKLAAPVGLPDAGAQRIAKDAAPVRYPEPAVEPPAREVSTGRHAAPPVDGADEADEHGPICHAAPQAPPESARERLQRILKFVARQEPGLRWAVGDRPDRTTVVVTDLAHGWIPPGIGLPAGVRLLTPERRSGNATALLGRTTESVAYTPGTPLGWATESDADETSAQPRELPAVDDLGWLLSEATHWRDGLPRMVHTLARAGAAGTGIVEAEIDLLRVHLDTARYRLLARYPDADAALLLNCMLLAAAERIASADAVSANYHFAWFQKLSAPPVSSWSADPQNMN